MSFSKKDEEVLLDLFKVYSPSRSNEAMISFLESYLIKNNLSYTRDLTGNIFNLSNVGKPILSAHMDSVGDEDCGFLNDFVNIFNYRNDRILRGMGNIGGDDKCGIFLILKALEFDKNLNFIFSIDEEIGCVGIEQVLSANSIEAFPYAIVLDRRGEGDIICTQNSYGNKNFEDELYTIGKKFKYSPDKGVCSDANSISKYINCANLSVAYHNPHSKKEFVSIMQLYNTYIYLLTILEEFKDKIFEKPISLPVVQKGMSNKNWKNPFYNNDYYNNDYYNNEGWERKAPDYYQKHFYCQECKDYVLNEFRVVFVKSWGNDYICKSCCEKTKVSV